MTRNRHSTRRALLAATACALALSAIPSAARTARVAEAPVDIEIKSTPIPALDTRDPTRKTFGQLEFRGGLVLTSSYRNFGGISSIRVAPDGARFIAVTDQGSWLEGRIVYDGTRPSGIADAKMAPLLGPDGKPILARGWYDAEALTQDNGTIYVALERVHRILKYDYARDGLTARAQLVPAPREMRKLPSNKGIEGMVFVPRGAPLAGTLIAFSERGLDADGNILAFLIGGPSPGTFAIKRTDDFDISDAALLPAGDVLILERRFTWTGGLAIRIRRIVLGSIRPGATVEGPAIFQADFGLQIDNMEGIAVHRSAQGETIITLVSDDNFSFLQRSIMLQFSYADR